MTTPDYSALITSEHNQRPKYMAMVDAVTRGMVDLQGFMNAAVSEYDIDMARWQQLDALGVRIGLNRNLQATTPGLYVQAPPAGAAPLSDGDYSVLLHGKIGSNLWDGTKSGAFVNLQNMFPGTGALLFHIDNQDMTMVICIAGAVLNASMKAALTCGYMGGRPEGVLATYAFTSGPGPILALDIENEYMAGLDVGYFATTVP